MSNLRFLNLPKTTFLFPFLLLLAWQVSAQTTLVPFGSSWKYLDNGSNQGTAWRATTFNDASWKTGNGLFGYGLSGVNTIVSYGPNAKKKYITTYFRKSITIADVSAYSSFTAGVKRDDGVVVYVNGTEVYRNNMPTGTITYRTLASGSSGGDDGATPIPFTIPATAFTSGTNVVAVEIHQYNVSSSDIAFDLELVGNTAPVNKPPVVSISSPSNGSSFTLSQTINITATASDPEGALTEVEFFANSVSLGKDNTSLYSVSWAPTSTGSYSLTAKATDAAGAATTSSAINVTITAAPVNYSLQIYTAGSGTVTKSPDQSTYLSGSTVTLTATPASGYTFSSWSGDASGNTNPLSVTMTSNKSITATFTQLDQTPPTVSSINRQSPTTEITTATTVIYRATFSEKVTGVDAADFTATTISGTVKGTVTGATAVGTTGTSYDITVGSITGTGTLRLDLKSSGTGIADVVGNAIQTGYTSGQSYTIQQGTPSTVTVIPYQSSWKYLDNGTDQGTAWRSTTFDDAGWKTGNGKLGYGIPDATTVVSYGPNASNKYITTYFRKAITIADASIFTSYAGNVKRDDGVVVYVNGTEVYRNNMPTGTITYRTLASGSSGGDDGATPIPFTIPVTAFTSGTNVVAVEIHQYSVSSSDIAFDLELVGKTGSSAALLTRGPYLQMGSQSAVTLRWRTDIPTDSKIEAGTTLGTYTLSATNPAVTTEHEVRITGLAANTKYYYQFGSSSQVLQSGSSNYFKTAPAGNSTSKVKVAFFGDTGTDPEDIAIQTNTLNAYLNYTGSNPAELLLLTGDLAEPNGTDDDYQKKYFNFYGQSLLKNHIAFPAPGNHEYQGSPSSGTTAPYFGIFTMPTAGESGGVASGTEAYYSFDWGNIHFISLDAYGVALSDNTRLYDTTGVQAKWLKQDLEATNKKWVIAYFHRPPYTMGTHNSDTESELVKIRQNLAPILDRYGVDLVVSGHSHNYERSYLLNGYYGNEASFNIATHTKSNSSAKYDGSANSCPYVTTSGAKNHGTVYVVAGSSGAIGTVQSGYPHNALPFAVNDGGMLYLEVEDNRLDGKMIRQNGTVFDRFTIMQDVNRTTNLTTAPGGTVELTASWVGTYRWSTGETTRSITVSPSSTTVYQVTDDAGCLTDVFNVNTTLATSGGEDSLTGLLKVYPTLVKKGAAITVSTNTPGIIEIFVSDIMGNVLYTSKFTGSTSIQTMNLPKGIYFISLSGKSRFKKHKFLLTD
ncbi:Ig-like domain-containing protein [Pontibacter ruber]|uniref:Ig-like domain-containing protein n=1 Tax=Pontibacter ruber TaxID=1343895 RepID=A0ABW5CVR4_9BACT|nr:Ig-like domain-containing protein [Pontibacter ruber]